MTTDRNREWTYEFYLDERGRSPVEEFLFSLDATSVARMNLAFVKLRDRNLLAKEPLVKHIEGDIWELREQVQGNAYRVLYFFFTGRRIILLHGFLKKTQKTPRRELSIARSRRRRFLEFHGG